MTRPEWTYDIERTEYTDQIFSSIGRLLYHATRFEAYCRSLSALLNLKADDELLHDVSKFNNFIKTVEKNSLFSNLDTVEKGLDVSEYYMEILTKARLARNTVAHEITNGLEYVFEIKKEEDALEQNIHLLSQQIIEGEMFIISMISLLTKEQFPSKQYVSNKTTWITNLE